MCVQKFLYHFFFATVSLAGALKLLSVFKQYLTTLAGLRNETLVQVRNDQAIRIGFLLGGARHYGERRHYVDRQAALRIPGPWSSSLWSLSLQVVEYPRIVGYLIG